DHGVAAVREPVGQVLGAPAGDVVPDVGAPAARGEVGIGDVRLLPAALGLAYRDLFPARGEKALRLCLEDLRHPAVEDEPQIIYTREIVRLQVRLHRRRALPYAAWDLAASHGDLPPRHARPAVHRHELADSPPDEQVRRR